jgi:RNA polymerase sigma-70 factor, ECF subfamily
MSCETPQSENIAEHLLLVKNFISRMMRGDQGAEDVVQQTMLKALARSAQFRFDSSLQTWLISIAINEVKQFYRSRSRWRATVAIDDNLEYFGSDSPEKCYESAERDRQVRWAASKLPASYRSVVELCFFQQASLQKAAEELGVSVGAVKSRLHRARKKLLLSLRKRRLPILSLVCSESPSRRVKQATILRTCKLLFTGT